MSALCRCANRAPLLGIRLGRKPCLARSFSKLKEAPLVDHFTQRTQEIAQFENKTDGWTAYPPHAPMNTTVEQFIAQYKETLESGARVPDVDIRTSGRIISKRDASKKLVFLDILQDQKRVQVMCAKGSYEGDFEVVGLLKRGDIIAVRGCPAKTKLGELTLRATEVTLQTPCLHDIPEKLSATETRFRQRYLDWMVNRDTIATFTARAKMLSALRTFLHSRGFLEVETPVLWPKPGGATATPFTTHGQALGKENELFLRIAPELFLKELVIGGMEKVFEVGKVFRNEGMDSTHNPEFTTCEFYQAYEDLEGLVTTTEALIRAILSETVGALKLTHNDEEIDFEPPFTRLDVMSTLEARAGMAMPDPTLPDADEQYIAVFNRLSLSLPSSPLTTARLIDGLIGHLIEPELIQPTFLLHHPVCLSPLAKSSAANPGVTQRFELFVAGTEICNAYEELNEPQEQRARLQAQQQLKTGGDGEAHPTDEHFCKALEYALPPTVGWGMGLDRLMMLICQKQHIREVLLFPATRPKEEHET